MTKYDSGHHDSGHHDSTHHESSHHESDWERWQEAWQGDDVASENREKAVVLPDARERRRWIRRARLAGALQVLYTASELIFGIAMLFFVVHWTRLVPGQRDDAVVPIFVGLFVVAEVVSLWNRRGTWRAVDRSARGYVELALLRERRKIFAVTRVVPAFLALELAVLLPWKYWQLSADPDFGGLLQMLPDLGWLALFVLLFLVGVAWWGRLLQRRVSRLATLLDDLSGDAEGDTGEGAGADTDHAP